MKRIAQSLALAISLVFPHSAFSVVGRVPTPKTSLGAVAATAAGGMVPFRVETDLSHLPVSDLFLNTLPGIETLPTASESLGAAAVPTPAPAESKAVKSRTGTPRAKRKAPARNSEAPGAAPMEQLRAVGDEVAGRETGDKARFALDRTFDGIESVLEDIPAPAVYTREMYGIRNLRDRRYAHLVHAARKAVFPKPRRGSRKKGGVRKKSGGLEGAYALLERIRKTDKALYDHSLRTGLMSGLVGLAMGLSENAARRVAWAATLHDIGKFEPEILRVINKAGRLDGEERAIMQKHTIVGARALEAAQDIDPTIRREASVVALQHHETANGKGYPFGLRGSEIALAASITHVADFLDALLENRPYRGGLSLEKAMKIMTPDSEKFNSDVWGAMRRLVHLATLPRQVMLMILGVETKAR